MSLPSLTPTPPPSDSLAAVARANASRFPTVHMPTTMAYAHLGGTIQGTVAADVDAHSLDNIAQIPPDQRDAAITHAFGTGFASPNDLDPTRQVSTSHNFRGWMFEHVVFASSFTPTVLTAVGLTYGRLTTTDGQVLAACPYLACWLTKVASDLGVEPAVITKDSPLAPYWQQMGFPIAAGLPAPPALNPTVVDSLPTSGVIAGQPYQVRSTGAIYIYSGVKWNQVTITGAPVAPPAVVDVPATTPAPATVTPPPPPPVPAAPSSAAVAHFGTIWPGMRQHILAAHGVVGPNVREAIYAAIGPTIEAAVEAGLIDQTGALVGGQD